MSAVSIGHITIVLKRKFGEREGLRLLAEAQAVQQRTGRDLRDVLVSLSGGRLVREASLKKRLHRHAKRFARRSGRHRSFHAAGVSLCEGGAPGLKQQRG